MMKGFFSQMNQGFITGQMQREQQKPTDPKDLSFGGPIYSDTLRQRTGKVDVLFAALEHFHKKYQEGSPEFVSIMTDLGLLSHYRGYIPTERMVSQVIARLPSLFPGKKKFSEMNFEDMKKFELVFGTKFIQEFTIQELIDIGF